MLYEEAFDHFNTSLRLNPANAAIIYNHRARCDQYQNSGAGGRRDEKGLTLGAETAAAADFLWPIQQMRMANLAKAVGGR